TYSFPLSTTQLLSVADTTLGTDLDINVNATDNDDINSGTGGVTTHAPIPQGTSAIHQPQQTGFGVAEQTAAFLATGIGTFEFRGLHDGGANIGGNGFFTLDGGNNAAVVDLTVQGSLNARRGNFGALSFDANGNVRLRQESNLGSVDSNGHGTVKLTA